MSVLDTLVSPVELELLDAGECMDEAIAQTREAEFYEDDDPEAFELCKVIEKAARDRFKAAHRAAAKARRI